MYGYNSSIIPEYFLNKMAKPKVKFKSNTTYNIITYRTMGYEQFIVQLLKILINVLLLVY